MSERHVKLWEIAIPVFMVILLVGLIAIGFMSEVRP